MGRIVNHASAGKKCIGTESPGKSSGFFTVNGNDMEIGIIILANERIAKDKLKIISPFFVNHFSISQKPVAASKQAAMFIPISPVVFKTLEKSASVAKK